MNSLTTSRSSRVIKKPKRDGDFSDDDQEAVTTAIAGTITGRTSGRSSRASASTKAAPLSSASDNTTGASSSKDGSADANKASKQKTAAQLVAEKIKAREEEDLRVWVECDKCGKWRALPATVDSSMLPDIWYCELNTYDTKYNSCSKEEEKAADTAEVEAEQEAKAAVNDTVGLRAFCGLWAKRLKCADKVVSYHQPGTTITRTSASTSSKRKKAVVRTGQDHQTDWIRCNNPMCGKWRAVAKGYDISGLLRRSLKRKWGGNALPTVALGHSSGMDAQPVSVYPTISSHSGTNVEGWYCWMNTWDDTKSSCSAPQEELYPCKWNLASSKVIL